LLADVREDESRPSLFGGLIAASTAEPKPSSVVLYHMQYNLRTLLIMMAVLPPILALLFAGNPLAVMLVIVGCLGLCLLCGLDWFQQAPVRPRKSWVVPSRLTIRDGLAISGIAAASCLAGLGLRAVDSQHEFVPVAALFVFGITCYGLGAFINHPRRI
jgi:hypothetical protein